jgi:DNA-binding transcriptional ArsR family regulator
MTLLDTLFGVQRLRALGWLLLHPDDAIHVREFARLTGTSASSLHRELVRLADAGLLLRNQCGNQVLYRANRDCPVFTELSGLFRKTGGLADILRQALGHLSEQIELALIFGSVARGEESSHSDIDILVIGHASFTEDVSAAFFKVVVALIVLLCHFRMQKERPEPL